ncbi:MAG: hypothetical protein B7733_25595 [Myxococcales bacterium FL481]|nr:MAG: hypothetical protein B7733_25595 [Myxococcales bacterium FL481]
MFALVSIELVATVGALALVGGGFALGQVVAGPRQLVGTTRLPTRLSWLGWFSPALSSAPAPHAHDDLSEFESSQHQRHLWRARQDIKRLEKTVAALEAERDDYRDQAVEARAAVEALVTMSKQAA